jgi:hypothetical protein
VKGGGKKTLPEAAPVVRGWLPFGAEIALTVAGVIYLVLLALGQTKKDPIGAHLPALLQHFIQAPGLFPNAAEVVTDYRLEAWSCADKAFVEVDTRPYFPMRPDDKENRFFRMASFYRSSAKVLGAFDDWFAKQTGSGGIRLYSLRLPIPPPGQIEPFTRRPLAEHPDAVKKLWYQTTLAERNRRCAGTP